MKIDTSVDAYQAAIEAIRELSKEDGMEFVCDRIVRLRVNGDETNEVLFATDAGYEWLSDWWEGNDVELLGFINLHDVEVPTLPEDGNT